MSATESPSPKFLTLIPLSLDFPFAPSHSLKGIAKSVRPLKESLHDATAMNLPTAKSDCQTRLHPVKMWLLMML